MAKVARKVRIETGRKRIESVLRRQAVANLRTLEQKISDAGPNGQRVQPHVLTDAKKELLAEGRIRLRNEGGSGWLHIADEDPGRIEQRINELAPLWGSFTAASVVRRTGQALEVAIYKAMLERLDVVTPYGGFTDLGEHDDGQLYSKQELQVFNGRSIGRRALDFIVGVGGDHCGIEAKNIRPWLYPHANEVKEAIEKALTLDVVPVLIGRRIPYVTFRLLGACGVLLHETYNQRMANADAELAAKVKHKDALGYHDIRVGNEPDARLLRFIGENLPGLVGPARAKLEEYRDLLLAFATREMGYSEFAARVRRRQAGVAEDSDEAEGEAEPDYDPFD